jgi:hypothetical protein
VVHRDIDTALRNKLQAVFLTLHQSKEGRAVLNPLMIDRFIPPDSNSYDAVRQMADEARGRIAQMVLRRLQDSRKPEPAADHSTEVRGP